jgi:hypothetical protein
MAQVVHAACRLERGMPEVRNDLRVLLDALDLVLLFGGKARVPRLAMVSAMCASMLTQRLCDHIDFRLQNEPKLRAKKVV